MRKLLVVALLFAFVASSCKKEDEPFELKMNYSAAEKAQLAKDEAIIDSFIVAKGIKDVKRTANGLYYVIVAPGSGNFKYTTGTQVLARYTGRLLNGQVFDSSTTGFAFNLTKVITGWQEGITLVQKGGKIRLLIPSVMAYGNRAVAPIPANAVLDFDVEVVALR
ncbi:MAG: FKBP-type peptidyl-prolyl cis-trans isomerase [Arcticibacter sp.]